MWELLQRLGLGMKDKQEAVERCATAEQPWYWWYLARGTPMTRLIRGLIAYRLQGVGPLGGSCRSACFVTGTTILGVAFPTPPIGRYICNIMAFVRSRTTPFQDIVSYTRPHHPSCRLFRKLNGGVPRMTLNLTIISRTTYH